MLNRLMIGLSAAALPFAASAQPPLYVDFTNRLTAAEPPPSGGEIAPRALEALKARARAAGGCVPTAVALDPIQSATLNGMVLPRLAARQIRNGWTVTGRPQGCGGMLPGRFLILRQPDATLDLQFVSAGEGISLVPPDAFVGAGGIAFAALSARKRGCKVDKMRFESTRIVSRSDDLGPDFHGLRFSGSWKEGWTFSGCGSRAEVIVGFTTSSEGDGTWRIDDEKTRLID